MNRYFLLSAILLLPFSLCLAKDKDKATTEKKAMDKELAHYQKELGKHPDKAATYWDHANAIAEFKPQIREARYFYEKALKIDSANADLFKDYGKYLFDKLYDLDGARSALQMAATLSISDHELSEYQAKIATAIEARDNEIRMRYYGTTRLRYYDTTTNYSALTNIDSLRKITSDASSPYAYRRLLQRYLADDSSLTPAEMYFLIIGYSADPEYSPFNYSEISAIKMIAGYNQDTAIKKALNLVNTNPLNPSLNRELMYCYRKKNDYNTAAKYERRIQQFFNGVLYSGNGTCSRPYISLWSREEYNFIAYLGCRQTETHSMENCAGQMAEVIDMVNPKGNETEHIYFNVKLIYMQATGK